MTSENLRLYNAMVWETDPNVPGRRVTVEAADLDDARRLLEAEYGEGNVYYLRNEEDAASPR